MATLKQLVDETTNIKNELIDCHTDLKNNLINKGVEVTNNDKMSNLIDKINDISGVFEEPAVKLRLFHADSNTDKLYELDVNTLQVIKTVNSPGVSPRGIGGGFDGNKLRLFHANSNTGKLYELNIDTLQVIKTVNSPGTEPRGIGGGHYTINKKYVIHNGIKYELKEV